MKDSTKKFAIGTIIAGAVGYVAGILTAPKSGKETRKDLRDAASHALAEGEKQLKNLHTELNDLLKEAQGVAVKLKGEAREQLEKAMSAGAVVKEKARVLLSAAHEGTAEDKDLQKAIKEANKAIEHLKTYLKK